MILEAMGKTGLSQVQIAARAGMSRSYLNEIISGIREITIHKAIGIERACHVFNAREAMIIQFDAIYERKIHKPKRKYKSHETRTTTKST